MKLISSLYKHLNEAGQKRPRSRLRKHSSRDARALDAIVSSEAYTTGSLTTLTAIKAAGLLDRLERSLPTGVVSGHVIYDHTDRPIVLNAAPGAGKTMSVGFPMLAEWPFSAFVIDVDGQYVRGVSAYRHSLGNIQVFLNANGLFGFPSSCLNVFGSVIDALQRGDVFGAIQAARRATVLLIPDAPEKISDSNQWISVGARKVIAMALMFLGGDHPERCNGEGLYDLLSLPIEELLDTIGLNASQGFAVREARSLLAEYKGDAVKQVIWKIQEAVQPLEIMEPGSPYARATATTDVQPSLAKTGDVPIDFYLMVEGRDLETEAQYLSLLMAYVIEEVASAAGDRPMLVLADEFSQLSKNRVLIKAMRAYRKRGIKIVTMSQGRQSTVDRYGHTLAHDIEDMAGTKIWMDPPLPIARELAEKGGQYTAISRNISDNADGRYATSYQELAQPNLSVAEIVASGGVFAGKTFIEKAEVPGLIIGDRVGWYDIYPYAEQLSDAYRDDHFRFEGSIL